MKKLFTMKTLIVLFSLLGVLESTAQQRCIADEISKQLIDGDAQVKKVYDEQEAFTKEFIQNYQSKELLKAFRSSKYIIPTVFHIVHDGGKENMEDSLVQEAVEIINEYFNRGNTAELNSVANAFKPVIADVGIEFRLAKKDPKGNPTNGINHLYSSATNIGLDGSKIKAWPRNQYLNIWVTRAVKADTTKFGTLAYSMYPSTVDNLINNKVVDGVITKTVPVKSTINNRSTLAHEIAHYLNIQHVWGNSNEPGVACGDDAVDDTPITEGNQGGCDINLSECRQGIIENEQNVMNYSDCAIMFTEGQKLRMWAALNSTVADRMNLWSDENLKLTGVLDSNPPLCAPIAEFGTKTRYACIGQNIVLSDYTYNTNSYTREWTFPSDANVQSSQDKNPIVYFGEPGWKLIQLKVENAYGKSSIQKSLIYINGDVEIQATPFLENFEDPAAINKYAIINYDNNNTQFQHTNLTGYRSKNSLKLNLFKSQFDGDRDEFITKSFDLSNLTDNQFNIEFDYSFAKFRDYKIDTNGAGLYVYLSKDCGVNWINVYYKKAHQLIQGSADDDYVPQDIYSWRNEIIDLNKINAVKNWKIAGVKIRFVMVGLQFENNFYLDNLNIGSAEKTYLSVNNSSSEFVAHLINNPIMDNQLKFVCDQGDISASVTDLLGNVILEKSMSNEKEHQIDMSQFQNGLYTLELKTAKSSKTLKFIK